MGFDDPSATLVELATPLPQYAVDFQVKTGGLALGLSAKHEWRQFVLTGAVLDVFAADKKTHSFNASDVAIEFLSEGVYYVDVKGKRQFVLHVPSLSRLAKFQHVLQLASASPQWSLPPVDVMTSLLSVAAEIVEAATAQPPADAIVTTAVTREQVQTHVAEMHALYQLQASCLSMEELYDHLLRLEAAYCADIHAANFAHTVHKLHPVQYNRCAARTGDSFRRSIRGRLSSCPHDECIGQLSLGVMYKIHVKGEPTICTQCTKVLSTGAFKIAAFIAANPRFLVTPRPPADPSQTLQVNTPRLPKDGSVQTFMVELTRLVKAAFKPTATIEANSMLQTHVATQVKLHFGTEFGSFGLDLVHAMLRQLDFVNKMCPNMEYWTNPVVIEAAIRRYHKFLHLTKAKGSQDGAVLVPTADIDLIWHTHQCDPHDYASFCTRLFGRIIDHDDTIEGGDALKGYADTFLLWAEVFDEPYSSFAPSYDAWTSDRTKNAWNDHFMKKRWHKFARTPSRDCRFVGVDESFEAATLPHAMAVMVPDEMAIGVSKTPIPDAITVFMAVIGTPVMDGRVRLAYSRHNYLMHDGGLGFAYSGNTSLWKDDANAFSVASTGGFSAMGCGYVSYTPSM